MMKNDDPWIEKYRPVRLKDIVDQTEVTKMLSHVLSNGNLPHLLFHGPPGTGKTSAMLSIAMELFGPKLFRERIRELNASDERGINVVRNKIITFAKMSIGKIDPKYPCPPYKIIILDEADAMTTEAQSALRKTIEEYSNVTRFCFICNYINQIIEPIASRCVKIRFRPINNAFMVTKLRSISNNENLKITDDALELVSKISKGDMRKGIMLIQDSRYFNKEINRDDIYHIANYIHEKDVHDLITKCVKCVNINQIIKLSDDIKCDSIPIYNLLMEINNYIINCDIFDDQNKCDICIFFSEIERRLIDGANESLQFTSILAKINEIYAKKLIMS